MRFIHAADIHLDSPLAGLKARSGDRAPALIGATRQAFDGLITLAITERVDFLLIAGDLYDGNWPDYATGLYFVAAMARLARAGIRVALVRGNHDAENRMTRKLALPGTVTVFEARKAGTLVWDDLGVAIHGRSFGERHEPENLVRDFPAPVPGLLNIGLLHTSADGRPPHAVYAPCSVAELRAKGYDYWALGHVHAREVLSQDPWIVFPGNLQGRDANETGAKGCTLVTAEAGRIARVDHQPLDVVRWVRAQVEVGACPDLEAVAEAVHTRLAAAVAGADGRTLAVRLTLTGRSPAHRRLVGDIERTRAECQGAALRAGDVWLERVEVATADPAAAGFAASDALAELLGTLAEAAGVGLGADLEALLDKLPAEIRREAGFERLDQAVLARVIDDARTILLDRLLGPGEAPALHGAGARGPAPHRAGATGPAP